MSKISLRDVCEKSDAISREIQNLLVAFFFNL